MSTCQRCGGTGLVATCTADDLCVLCQRGGGCVYADPCPDCGGERGICDGEGGVMTRLEATRKRAEAGLGGCKSDERLGEWIAHADDDRSWLLERLDELARFCREHMELHGGYWHRTISEALAKLDEETS